ncbi:hypothetical protein N482_04810 [Pseudoalteromonas luteoviolacea NCIMB 1942]|uniref:Uncharacterized protein n=1 Tax=Pseudoalteromonas luteoviolacea NCIMB 1942 TaxID=1365253 RepID=A0A167GLP7_9GAMM|nr:hypothetical protein N482_04810 [Pseudoalteromonas luteoviolacea NCIMB 1942]
MQGQKASVVAQRQTPAVISFYLVLEIVTMAVIVVMVAAVALEETLAAAENNAALQTD